MPSTGFEPTIPVSERPQTHALDRAATGIIFTLAQDKFKASKISTIIAQAANSCGFI
jgi:hypothetical protein